MNHIYRCLFNTSLGAWVAVSETATQASTRGRKRRQRLLGVALTATLVLTAQPVLANGDGGAGATGASGGIGTGTGSTGNGGATASSGNDGTSLNGTVIAGGATGVVYLDSPPTGSVTSSDNGSAGQLINSASTITISLGSSAVGSGGGGGFDAIGFTVTGNANGGDGGDGLVLSTGSATTYLSNSGQITGGGGGGGGRVSAADAAGSTNGGAGGVGLVLGAGSEGATVVNFGQITGGGGGGGGYSQSGTSSIVGAANGGDGGDAVSIADGSITLTNEASGTIAGGSGGSGGTNIVNVDSAGLSQAGGNGGVGIAVSAVDAVTISNAGSIVGGAGGDGAGQSHGGGGTLSGTVTGGDGGSGILLGSTSGYIANTGFIGGGDGGAGATISNSGVIASNGAGGSGGIGVSITGDGNTLVNDGIISGGLSGQAGDRSGGGVRANAVDITGNGNTLELDSNATFVGNVVSTGTANVLAFGGTANGSFDVSAIVSAIDSTNSNTQYTGFASYAKTGTSLWTLSGTNSLAMNWAVNAGTLAVDASMANAAMTVNSGGTLTGTGSVGTTTIASGGTLAASTIGSGLSINGALAFQSGSTYAVSVDTTGGSGVTAVSGAVTIASGATLALSGVAGTYNVGTTYTLLTYASETGSFSNVNVNYAYVTPTLTYGSTALTLNLSGTDSFVSSGFGIVGNTDNQRSVAGALTRLYAAGGNSLTSTLLTASTGEAQRTLGNLAGDSALAFGQIAANHMQGTQDAIGQRMASIDMASAGGRGISTGDASPTRDVWAAISYANTRQSGDATTGAGTYIDRAVSLSFGHDIRLNDNWLVGGALSGNDDSISYENASANGRSDGVQAALYARYRPSDSPFFVKGMASFGWWSNTLSRQVTLGTLSGNTRGTFNTAGGSLYGETGITLPIASFVVEPYVGASIARYRQQGYSESTESGSDEFALNYGGQTTTEGATVLGTRVRQTVDLGGHPLTWQAELAWRHRIGPSNASTTANFTSAADYSFQIQGVARASDEAIMRLGASYAFNDSTTGYLMASALLGSGDRTFAGTAGVRWLW